MCTGMIQSLEWLLFYPITVAGILNLYLNFCQRWYLTLFKLDSLLLFFLKQHSSREESNQGWCCPAFHTLGRRAGCSAHMQDPFLLCWPEEIPYSYAKIPIRLCLPGKSISEAWDRGRKKLPPKPYTKNRLMLCKQLCCERPSGRQPCSCLRVLSPNTSPKQKVTEVEHSWQCF